MNFKKGLAMKDLRNSPSYYPDRRALLEDIAKLTGTDADSIEAMLEGVVSEPQPTFEEIANEPKPIERVCNCCGRTHFVSVRVAERCDPSSPWNFCLRCFDYASTGDLTIEEQSRFPISMPDDATIARLRKMDREA